MRRCLMVMALALGVPLTLAWVGLLGLLSFDALAWLLDLAIG